MEGERKKELKKRRRKLLIILLILSSINILIYLLFNQSGGYSRTGEYIEYSFSMALKGVLVTVVLAIPLLGFILALLFNFIPHKDYLYSESYRRTALIIMIIINSALLIYQSRPYIADLFTMGRVSKEEQIEKLDEFKQHMLSYRDSSLHYFDKAINEFSTTGDTQTVSIKYSPALLKYEYKTDSLSRFFHLKLTDYGLSQEDYNKAMQEIQSEFKVVMLKFNEFRSLGLDIIY